MFFPIIIFFSCTAPTTETYVGEDGKTVYVTIYHNDYDTIVDTLEYKKMFVNYNLFVSKYCLNDTGVCIVFEDDTSITKNLYHNYAVNIKLDKKRKNIFDIIIDKSIFKDSLDSTFYEHAVIYNIQYKEARTNKLYFNVFFAEADSDSTTEFEMSVFYKNRKLGEIEYCKVK